MAKDIKQILWQLGDLVNSSFGLLFGYFCGIPAKNHTFELPKINRYACYRPRKMYPLFKV